MSGLGIGANWYALHGKPSPQSLIIDTPSSQPACLFQLNSGRAAAPWMLVSSCT
jgi:hypothetical protein